MWIRTAGMCESPALQIAARVQMSIYLSNYSSLTEIEINRCLMTFKIILNNGIPISRCRRVRTKIIMFLVKFFYRHHLLGFLISHYLQLASKQTLKIMVVDTSMIRTQGCQKQAPTGLDWPGNHWRDGSKHNEWGRGWSEDVEKAPLVIQGGGSRGPSPMGHKSLCELAHK